MDAIMPILALAGFIGVPVFLIWGKRAFDRAAASSLEEIYAAANREARAFGEETPEVSFRYHTYSGILLYVTQTEHQLQLPYPVARDTLSALLKHTMRYGFFAYGALLIPGLAYLNYLAQRRRIAKQQAALPGRGRARTRSGMVGR